MSADLRKRAEAIVEAHCENGSGGIFTGGDDLRECIYDALVAVRDESLEDAAGVSEMMANGWRDVQGKPELQAPVAAVAWRIRALKVKP